MCEDKSYPEYPKVTWGTTSATFSEGSLDFSKVTPHAVLCFAIDEGLFVLADIVERGWCIPSGHIEADETAADAARRETLEEVGCNLGILRHFGYFQLQDSEHCEPVTIPVFVASVTEPHIDPTGTDSRGVRRADLNELPSCYYIWDELLEAVFRNAYHLWVSYAVPK